MKRDFYSFIIFFLFFTGITSGQNINLHRTLDWSDAQITENKTDSNSSSIPSFRGATYTSTRPIFPLFSEQLRLDSKSEIKVVLKNTVFEPVTSNAIPDYFNQLTTSIQLTATVVEDREKHYARFYFIPLRKTGNDSYEKLVSFDAHIEINEHLGDPLASRGPEFKTKSELSEGSIYKISVNESGIVKLDYNFFKDQLGINPDQTNPVYIRVLGNGGGVLPEPVLAERIDDLQEVAAKFIGEDDQTFNEGDYLIFYAEGPHGWDYSHQDQAFHMTKNIYEDFNYYFIQIGNEIAQRIQVRDTENAADYSTSTFDDYLRLEEDKVNLLGKYRTPGSGKTWFGDEFSGTRSKDYSDHFAFPGIVPSDTIRFQVSFAARSDQNSQYHITINGETFSRSISKVNLGDVENKYARIGTIQNFIIASDEDIQQVEINYPPLSGTNSSGWLDYIELNARRSLDFSGTQLEFRDRFSAQYPITGYQIGTGSIIPEVWDITNPSVTVQQEFVSDGEAVNFNVASDGEIREFIAFNPEGPFINAIANGEVENQNLHGLQQADLLIIYHEDFEAAAERLVMHRRDFSQYSVASAEITKVFNEFSGGAQDPTAIREFARMLYGRSPDFRYLLLIGDGSYDMRRRNENIDDDNFIPVYETNQSLDPISSFPSDDYYSLLSDSEGGNLKGAIDIAVGRLPVSTAEEANAVVTKLINYDLNPETLGDWRLKLGFVADDEDNNLHLNQTDRIATRIDTTYDFFNLEKLYLDAFPQESTPGGERYSQINEGINNNVFKGMLALNYLGHGGHNGWAQERVLRIPEIQGWKNLHKLPLFVTATCSFTGYDEPSYVSAGEEVLLNPQGGGIGLLTTVRAVYSSSNERLTREVFELIFERVDGKYLPIGEVMRIAKNNNPADTLDINARKFSIIGDPSMLLALPKHQVVATNINGTPVHTAIDTIGAMDKVTVRGEIQDIENQKLTGFNGTLFTTVFDKPLVANTLANDAKSIKRSFEIQNKVLFKGSSTVQNGEFEFSFVVPEDINFDYGHGKMSFYASNGLDEDAAGVYNDFIIGGVSDQGISDDEGPEILIYMDDESFVFGGTTDPNPILLLYLSDDNGINILGNSIGHDLEAVIDDNTQNSIILNDFYESTLDDYTSGVVRYPLSDLEAGRHSIGVTAWDISNNFSEAYTEFVVAKDLKTAITHILNYPNPFSESTTFQFEHNLAGESVDVIIQIFSISGRLIKTIEALNVISAGNKVGDIVWEGLDDSGHQIARGLYFYKVILKHQGTNGEKESTESKFKKLVIVK
jgi:hypothetical protein